MIDNISKGQMTARIAEKLSRYYDKKLFKVIHDHALKKENKVYDDNSPIEENNVGEIASWFGLEENRSRRTRLSQLDIAVVERNTDKVFALIEVEETINKPKTLLGDVFAALWGNYFTFGDVSNHCALSIGNWTTLIVMCKDSDDDKDRIGFLNNNVETLIAAQSGEYPLIRKVFIESFTDELELERKLKNQIEAARIRTDQIMPNKAALK